MKMSLVESLRDHLEQTIAPLVHAEPRRLCILDVPDYPNVGDPAILLGELEFFGRKFPNARMTLVSHRQYDETVDAEVEASDAIFLHGGGSFGNIWPAHHDFRLSMLRKFAHRHVVQLPQSIHFNDQSNLELTRQLVAGMKKFDLIVRDRQAYEFATKVFDCDVHLAPDMAFALGPQEAAAPVVDLLCLMRTDKESRADESRRAKEAVESSGLTHEFVDWLENRQNIERAHDVARKLSKYGLSRRLLARHGLPLHRAYAGSRLRFGLDLLARGRTVITDRLHGHILSTLLGKKQLVLDSMDGKVRLFNETWLSTYENARFVSGADELRDLLQLGLSEAA